MNETDAISVAMSMYDDGYNKGRIDAIDEFVERITLPLTEEDIERIAMELKEQQ